MSNPVLVEVLRGEFVESAHQGAVAVSDAAGRLVLALGDVERPVYGRSAVKPIQALPLVATGAADAFRVGPAELALACASHRGEKVHVAAVGDWLGRIGLSASDLECGAHAPYDAAAAAALIRAGAAPCPLHNNCSGKHTGFLTTARHLGEATGGYIDWEHPVQRRVTQALAETTGIAAERAPRGVDGCGIPVLGIPLEAMAEGMARLADPARLPAEFAASAPRIVAAMTAEPMLVDGSGRFATAVMEAAPGRVAVKPGAEGVFCAILPELGLGVALKIADGAGRASEVAMGAVLQRLGVLGEEERRALAPFLRPIIKNVAGRTVGEIRPAEALLG